MPMVARNMAVAAVGIRPVNSRKPTKISGGGRHCEPRSPTELSPCMVWALSTGAHMFTKVNEVAPT